MLQSFPCGSSSVSTSAPLFPLRTPCLNCKEVEWKREVDSGGGGGTFIGMAGFLQSPGCRSCLLLYAVKWAAFSHLSPFSSPSQELSHNLNSEDCSRSGGSGGGGGEGGGGGDEVE